MACHHDGLCAALKILLLPVRYRSSAGLFADGSVTNRRRGAPRVSASDITSLVGVGFTGSTVTDTVTLLSRRSRVTHFEAVRRGCRRRGGRVKISSRGMNLSRSWATGDYLTHRFNPELGIGRVTALDGRALVVEFPRSGTTLRLAAEHRCADCRRSEPRPASPNHRHPRGRRRSRRASRMGRCGSRTGTPRRPTNCGPSSSKAPSSNASPWAISTRSRIS